MLWVKFRALVNAAPRFINTRHMRLPFFLLFLTQVLVGSITFCHPLLRRLSRLGSRRSCWHLAKHGDGRIIIGRTAQASFVVRVSRFRINLYIAALFPVSAERDALSFRFQKLQKASWHFQGIGNPAVKSKKQINPKWERKLDSTH